MHKKYEQTVACEVAVFGGGVSGVAAAVAAARQGARVLLIEREDFLGGAAVSGLGLLGFQDRKGNPIIGGIAQEIVDRLYELHGSLGHNPCPILNSLTPINAALMRLLFFQLCEEAGVMLLLGCLPVEVTIQADRIHQVSVCGKGCLFSIEAQVFIDATGDGDLCALAQLPFEKGEPDGELQPASLIFAVSGINKEQLLKYVEEHPEEVETPEGYEMTLEPSFFRTVDGYNLLGLEKCIKEAKLNGDYRNIPRDQFSLITHPNDDTTIINNTRLIHFDGTDLKQLSDGTLEAFRQVEELVHFMPRYLPGYAHCSLSFIAPTLGIRESRHFLGRRRLLHTDVYSGLIPADTVALCGYNVDIHHGRDKNSELYIVQQAYGIPYGCMLPEQLKGLLFTGRLICTDRIAFGSCRIMSTCLALGQAAGTAAALCIQEKCSPDEIQTDSLCNLLKQNGAILTISQEEDIDAYTETAV